MTRCAAFLRAGAEIQHGQKLGAGINGQPEPLYLRMAPQPCSQFVQLDVREPKMAEEAFVQSLCVLASTREPPRNRGLSKAEDPRGCRRVQSFRQRREHHGDLLRRGFQPVQGGVASRTEDGTAGLTPKGLNLLGTAMLAIADQRVFLCVSVAKVRALPVETGEALGGDALRSSPPAFHLAPGTNRSMRWPSSHRGNRAETTGGAIVWATGLEETVEHVALDPFSRGG